MIHFIFNPFAGKINEQRKSKFIDHLKNIPNSVLHITNYAGHGSEIARELLSSAADRIIVVGGDGSVNEVAKVLSRSNIPLGIIPLGSGNGLARHLKIPMDFYKAVDLSVSGLSSYIDIGIINGRMFFCTAGIGFDANVAHHFAKSKKRGLLNYIKSSLRIYVNYKPIKISINGSDYETLFSCTIANANQFGNNAFISPHSKLNDGQLELVKILPSNIFGAFIIAYRMFKGNLHKSKKIQITSFEFLDIKFQKHFPIHVDGEAVFTDSEILNFKILKNGLFVVSNQAVNDL